MRTKFYILSICSILLSCKRDAAISVPSSNLTSGPDCRDTSNIPPITDTLFSFPRFNPNNSNEIIYLQGLQSAHMTRIVKRNLTTGQESVIVNNVWQMSDWSVKDWIVFNHADNQVWKVKSNGDSLTLLTTNMQGGFYAVWSPDGNKIAFNPAGIRNNTIICDANGIYLDSIPYSISLLTQWSKNGLYLCGRAKNHYNIEYQNINTRQAVQPTNNIANAQSTNRIDGFNMGWLPNSQEVIWASCEGLYKTNIIINQTVLLKPTCTNRYYCALSVSPDGKKIIAQRIDIASGFCLMDIDGKNEVIIK